METTIYRQSLDGRHFFRIPPTGQILHMSQLTEKDFCINTLGRSQFSNVAADTKEISKERFEEKLRIVYAGLESGAANKEQEISDYKEVLEDKHRLTREIDAIINGADAPAQASLIDLIPQIKELVNIRSLCDKIRNMHPETGRPGCTYGDTQYDSESTCYGYNLALEHIKDTLQ